MPAEEAADDAGDDTGDDESLTPKADGSVRTATEAEPTAVWADIEYVKAGTKYKEDYETYDFARLGKVDLSEDEMTELLSNGDVTITLCME